MALRSIWAQAAGQKSPLRPFARYSLYIATWIPVAICFHDYVGGYIKVSGPSMYPYLNDNYNESLQQAMCLQVKWMARQHLNRGMIVTLRSPLDPEKVQIKRVIGLEGDIIHARPPYPTQLVRVPQGHIWVEGDIKRTDMTVDSNTYGPISKELVTGYVPFIISPWRKFGWVRWWEYRDGIPTKHR